MSALKRVGHKGAGLLAPGNTRASFDAALEAGVDMIEFDVLPAREQPTRLVLAHDYEDADAREPEALEEALAHLAQERFAAVELDVDLKLPGCESAALGALREFGLLDRALICSQHPRSLAVIRAAEPGARLGWSVPRLREDPFRRPVLRFPAYGVAAYARRAFPARAERALASGICDAIMAHWRLATPRLVQAVRRGGGELYVWTVDEPERISALERLGVTGVITNDPRLFAAARAGTGEGASAARTAGAAPGR